MLFKNGLRFFIAVPVNGKQERAVHYDVIGGEVKVFAVDNMNLYDYPLPESFHAKVKKWAIRHDLTLRSHEGVHDYRFYV